MGERVDIPGGGGGAGYLAAPEGAGLGVLVIEEGWGLSPHIEGVCDRLASEGFTALVPDLAPDRTPDRPVPDREPDPGEAHAMALDLPQAARELAVAVDFLLDHPAVRGHGIGVVGFGMGGALALWLAAECPGQVTACVPFYAAISPAEAQPDWGRIEAAVEGHYGEGDGWATSEEAHGIERQLADRGKEVRLFLYPGQGHGFFNEYRLEAFDEDAARQAWVRTLEFLRAKLG